MVHPLRTRAERAKLHVAMLDALPPEAEATGLPSGRMEAFAEAVCWADSGEIADLATIFGLADAIAHFVFQAVHHSDCQYAEVSADDLREVHGIPTTNLALKLAGYLPRQKARKVIWTDATEGQPTVIVTLPPDLLEQWNSE